jgi:hypothetical protein
VLILGNQIYPRLIFTGEARSLPCKVLHPDRRQLTSIKTRREKVCERQTLARFNLFVNDNEIKISDIGTSSPDVSGWLESATDSDDCSGLKILSNNFVETSAAP